MIIFAELLVAGIQATVWVGFLAASFFGTAWIEDISLERWAIPLGAIAVSLVYALGVIVDRAADAIFEPWDYSLRRKVFGLAKGDEHRISRSRLEIVGWNPEMAKDLAYARSRVRLLRASALNLLLMVPTGAIFMLARTNLHEPGATPRLLVTLVSGVLAAAGASWGWARLSKSQYTQLKLMDQIRKGDKSRDG